MNETKQKKKPARPERSPEDPDRKQAIADAVATIRTRIRIITESDMMMSYPESAQWVNALRIAAEVMEEKLK